MCQLLGHLRVRPESWLPAGRCLHARGLVQHVSRAAAWRSTVTSKCLGAETCHGTLNQCAVREAHDVCGLRVHSKHLVLCSECVILLPAGCARALS